MEQTKSDKVMSSNNLGLTKQVLEAGLEVELEEHLGYVKHAGRERSIAEQANNPPGRLLPRLRPSAVLTVVS